MLSLVPVESQNNTAAYGKGGGVLATDSSLLGVVLVLAEGVSVAYNAAAMDFGGGVALTGDASMVVGCTCKRTLFELCQQHCTECQYSK